MAILTKAISKQFLDDILPVYGNQRKAMPVYDNSQRAFICDQYISESGHIYYKALRFCDRIAIVEKVAMAYNWTYINGIEIYSFNGQKFELIQKKEFETPTYHNVEFIKKETTEMLLSYLKSMQKVTNTIIPVKRLEEVAGRLVEESYKSFLDEDFDFRLTRILPIIEEH